MPPAMLPDAPRSKRSFVGVLLGVPALLGVVHLLYGSATSVATGASFLTPRSLPALLEHGAAFAVPAVTTPRLPAVTTARATPYLPAEAWRSRGASMSVESPVEGAPCLDDEPAVSDDSRVTGTTLRSIQLKDVNGRTVEMKDYMGGADGKAVVVFLRHLG